MIYELVGHTIRVLLISQLCTINYIFKLCFSKKAEAARFYFNFFIFYLTIFLCALFYFPLFIFRPRNLRNAYLLLPVFEYLSQEIIGLELTIRNAKVLAKDQGAVVVENHQSSLEILLLCSIWRKVVKTVIGVSKKELLYLFPFGPTTYLMGTLFLDRKSKASAIRDLDVVGQMIVEGKAKAWTHPEGTRNSKIGSFLPFKKGVFFLAVKSKVPIIPVVVSPYYFLDYEKPFFKKPRVIMQVLDEIPTTDLTSDDVPELVTRVQQQMWEAYEKLHEEVMSNYANRDDDYTPGSLTIQ